MAIVLSKNKLSIIIIAAIIQRSALRSVSQSTVVKLMKYLNPENRN